MYDQNIYRDPAQRVSKRRASCRGFTLMELVAIIVIIGVLATVAAPSLRSLDASKENLGARRAISAMRHAQALAMATHRRTWVAFDTTANSFSVYVEDPANPGRANRLPAIDPLTRGNMITTLNSGSFTGVSISAVTIGGTAELQYDSLGRPFDQNDNALTADGLVSFSGGQSITITKGTGYIIAN